LEDPNSYAVARAIPRLGGAEVIIRRIARLPHRGARVCVPVKNPCSGKKEFPVFGGTGNSLQAVESAW
jgi:hypothetical protein